MDPAYQLVVLEIRDHRLRGYLVSFARCPRVETDLAAAVLPFDLNLVQCVFCKDKGKYGHTQSSCRSRRDVSNDV